MIYIFAMIGVITVAVLLWRLFAAQQPGETTRRHTTAPDDDPEFLRRLGEQQHNQGHDDD